MDNEYFNKYTMQEVDDADKTALAQKLAALPKVCFDVLENKKGHELRILISEIVLQQPVNHRLNSDYERACVYTEGMKAAFRQLFSWSDMFKMKLDMDAKKQKKASVNE